MKALWGGWLFVPGRVEEKHRFTASLTFMAINGNTQGLELGLKKNQCLPYLLLIPLHKPGLLHENHLFITPRHGAREDTGSPPLGSTGHENKPPKRGCDAEQQLY